MKIYFAHVYKNINEYIPPELTVFINSINQKSDTIENADVHLLYIGPKTELTQEFQWIQQNSKNVVAIILTKKYRKLAPTNLTWQECISLTRQQDVDIMIDKLNAHEWSNSNSRQQRKHQRNQTQILKNYKKAEQEKIKYQKNNHQIKKNISNIINLSGNSNIDIPVPKGATNIKINLIINWELENTI
jgi:hypothetical protein